MPVYDIMQVDDEDDERKYLGRAASRQNLTYFGVSSLQELVQALPTCSGKVFLIDGNFPETPGGSIHFLAPEAISSIRQYYPDAKIFLYSSSGTQKKADTNKVGFLDKLELMHPELIERLKQEIHGSS